MVSASDVAQYIASHVQTPYTFTHGRLTITVLDIGAIKGDLLMRLSASDHRGLLPRDDMYGVSNQPTDVGDGHGGWRQDWREAFHHTAWTLVTEYAKTQGWRP